MNKWVKILLVLCIFCGICSISPVYAAENVNEDANEDTNEPEVEQESEIEIKSYNAKLKKVVYKQKTVELVWDKVPKAKKYVIKQKTKKGGKELIRTNKRNIKIVLDKYGKEFVYYVEAYDKNDSLIGVSKEINVYLPSEVKNLRTTGTSRKKVKLSWDKSAYATSYIVYQLKDSGKYKRLGETKINSYKIEVEKDKKYTFKVVAVLKNKEVNVASEGKLVSYNNKEFVSINHQKYTYKEMVSDIKALCKKYSDYVSYSSLGKSEKNNDIYEIVLGNPNAPNTLLVVCSIHAREYVTTALGMKQLEYYLINYNSRIDGVKPADVFAKCSVHYIMMANPDGVIISQTKKSTWKANANGVNLNRNFPTYFKVEGDVKDNSYSGKKAASEKETKIIMNETKRLKKAANLAVVNYHAMGQIVFGDYSGSNMKLKKKVSQMYNVARETTGYRDAKGYSGASHGSYRDYVMHGLDVPSITIEVGSSPCPVPVKQYKSIFNKNKLVILREAQLL